MIYHLKKARDHEEAEDIDAAIKEAEIAMNEDPQSSRPVRELGYLFIKKNDLKKAEKWLLKAAKMNGLDVFAFHYLGELYLKQNEIEKASNFFEMAMNVSPRHVTRGMNFGKILVKKNMTKKAEKVFDKVVELSDNSLALSEEIADFCFEHGMFEYSIKYFDFILKNIPTHYGIMVKLGMAYERLGQYKKALKILIDAEKKNMDNIEIKMNISKIYFKTNQLLRAEHMLKSVVQIDPEQKEAQELLQQVYKMDNGVGRPETAITIQ
jgi:tetratricopeptide (TPR) repeat protein